MPLPRRAVAGAAARGRTVRRVSFLYFAYGSNLLPARLQARCPSARVVGPALAPDHRLEFTKPGRDGSGKATLHPASGAAVPGVLYRIDLADQPALHAAEGAGHPNGYVFHAEFAVRMADGDGIAATYVARQRDAALRPFDWYLALVIAGAQAHGLGADHVARLKSLPHAIDAEPENPIRRAAIAAFDMAGIADYRRLLADQG